MALVLPPGYRNGDILFKRLKVPSGFEIEVKNSVLFIEYLLYRVFVNYAIADGGFRLNNILENIMKDSIRKYINLIEGFDPRMSPDQIRDLADDAANAAVKHIQDQLGVQSGDLAGLHFSGDNWDSMINILSKYIQEELRDSN